MEQCAKIELSKIDQMQDGYSFENYIANLLKYNGYTNVIVTEKSRDYGADIIASFGNDKIAFQCKQSISDIGVKAVQEALSGKLYYKCTKAVVVTNRYFTSSAITLAAIAHVDLWNRQKLSTYLSPFTTQTESSIFSDADNLFMNAVGYVLSKSVITTAELQIKFNIGYAQASILLEKMNSLGIVGPWMGSRPRQVLIDKSQFSFGVSEKSIEQQKAVQQNYDFRKIYWGMDKKQVVEQEGNPDMQLPKGAYIYQGYHVIGYDCDYSIGFNKNGVACQGVYMFSLSHDLVLDYLNDFNNICKITSKKYGTPFSQGEDWKNGVSAETADKNGPFLNGDMEYYAYWQTETTTISLNLYHDNFGTSCILSYATKSERLKDTTKNEIDLSEI